MPITRAELRAVTSLDAATRLFRGLGYDARPVEIDAASIGIPGFQQNRLIRSGVRRREGYAIFLAETRTLPRSFAAFARRLREGLHDFPIGVLGVPDHDGAWERVVLVRPRVVQARGRIAYRAAKLEVLVTSPTHHDADVFERLRWQEGDDAQKRIDDAFDVEAVTRAFFEGLRRHFERLEAALEELGQKQPHILRALDQAGGHHRVAIRIVAQLLFTWFLQRKGLLANDREYLLTRWRRREGLYYPTVLEPLFYEAFALPEARRAEALRGRGIPFLNGGLFQRAYGDVSLPLPDTLFDEEEGLLDYFSRWTFTLSEEAPDEVDVAVDPELLGRIFEHLISDEEQSRHGVVYTPRPVVQFMCREALVQHLTGALDLDESWCRRLLVDDDAFQAYQQERGSRAALDLSLRLQEALDDVHVLDPAVGSGAFLLGMMGEIIRLRQLAYRTATGRDPSKADLRAWKLAALEKNLFGVDIEPLALELCRLRLWLALMVDVKEGEEVPPLPNLEYRTVAADSLTDFVGGVEVQNTRGGEAPLFADETLIRVDALRRSYFYAAEPVDKERLRDELKAEEDRLVGQVLDQAGMRARQRRDAEQERYLQDLRQRFSSHDRVYPVFIPQFHAPEVLAKGGFDIVILNPPYLGKKQVAQKVRDGKISEGRIRDYERHHGERTDLMILFGYRARELVRPGGVCSVIFNDSLFTSADAERLRQVLWDEDDVRVLARTRCFEGQAVNGGIVVWRREKPSPETLVRWVEGYKRDPRDLAAASDPIDGVTPVHYPAGESEVWQVGRSHYEVIPSRPLFRPAPEAIHLVELFSRLEPTEVRSRNGWANLSNTRGLNQAITQRRRTGWYDHLTPGTFVPLGYCIVGGQGLATADDLFFLAAVEGSEEAERGLAAQERLEGEVLRHPEASRVYERLRAAGHSREQALLALHEDTRFEKDRSLHWPRLLRVAPRALVRRDGFSEEERREGIRDGPFFVPFEKGDQSDEDDAGRAIGAAWWRENPIVIDWSYDAVQLLRRRARQMEPHRKPRIQNEDLWGLGGVTWNRVARYFNVRLVPEGAIFSDKAPTITPSVPWLSTWGLLSLLNSSTIEFIVRTFLGSLMQIEIGDIRRVPVPVLTPAQSAHLSALGQAAVAAVQRGDREEQRRLEEEVDAFVRDLYGVSKEAELWIVR